MGDERCLTVFTPCAGAEAIAQALHLRVLCASCGYFLPRRHGGNPEWHGDNPGTFRPAHWQAGFL